MTLGGGFTMVKGSASGRSGRNEPFSSQCAYQRASICAGSNVVSRLLLILHPPMPMLRLRSNGDCTTGRLGACDAGDLSA